MLLVMTFMTTEFGRALYQYNTVMKSVRDASRYLSVQTPNTHQAEAANLIVYGNLAGTGPPLAPGLNTSHVLPPVWASTGTLPAINAVTVTVRGYQFRSLFTSFFGQRFGTNGVITYSDITATMRSHL